MSALDDYKMFLNVLASDEDGIAGDLINKWAKAKAIIHAMDQGKMTPPPVPPEITEPEPTISQPPVNSNMEPAEPTATGV